MRDFIEYIKDYKRNTKELVNLQRDLGYARYTNKQLVKENKLLEKTKNDYLDTINEKNKEIRRLKKELKKYDFKAK